MASPFFGLDIGVSGLRAAQQELDTAAHNAANANTPGYSRQVVNLEESIPWTYPSFTRSGLPGQVGTGVTVASITRVHDNFLDAQVQQQTALQNQWDTRNQLLSKIQSIFPEPSTTGLGSAMSAYYSAWQDVANDPSSTAARTSMTEQAANLAMDLNSASGQLKIAAQGIDTQISQQVVSVNDLATQIASINGQIQRVSISGSNPNDLLDQREQLLEKLNAIVPTTELTRSDGTLSVLVGGVDLVSNVNARQITTTTDASGNVNPVWSDGSPVQCSSGQMKALLDARDVDIAGYVTQLDQLSQAIADSTNTLLQRGVDANGNPGQALFTYYPGNVAQTLAINPAIAANPQLVAAASTANAPGDGSVASLIAGIQSATSYSAGVAGANLVGGMDLTTGSTARLTTVAANTATAQTYTMSSSAAGSLTLTGANGSTQTISVADMAAGGTQVLNFDQLGIQLTVTTDASSKAASDLVTDLTGAGHNSLVVASLFNPPQTGTDFYAGLVGKIGASAAQATEMSQNQQLVVQQLTSQVQQQSGVSLDEEATNMLEFQHAYQASARVITAMDEVLNTLINNTGVVGR